MFISSSTLTRSHLCAQFSHIRLLAVRLAGYTALEPTGHTRYFGVNIACGPRRASQIAVCGIVAPRYVPLGTYFVEHPFRGRLSPPIREECGVPSARSHRKVSVRSFLVWAADIMADIINAARLAVRVMFISFLVECAKLMLF